MPKIAQFGRSRVAAILTATVSTLAGCQSMAPQSGAAPQQEGPRVTFPPLSWTAPAAAPTVVQAQGRAPAGPTIIQAQGRPHSSIGQSTPTDIAGGAPRNEGTSRVSVSDPGVTVVAAPSDAAGCSSGEGNGGFWSDPRSGRRLFGADRLNDFDQFDQSARADWQNLPRMLGDQGRPLSGVGASTPTDITSGAPRTQGDIRGGSADVGGAGAYSNLRVAVEIANPEGTGSFGAVTGTSDLGGASSGLAPSLYVKRVLASSEHGLVGVGLGGTLPTGGGQDGNIFPWAFCATRVTGDTWLQSLVGVSVPFGSSQETVGYADAGLVVPLYEAGPGARGVKLYFLPELHANFGISGGDGGGGGNALTQEFGNPGFVLNSTIGFGARVGSLDIQSGIAFPLLTDRFYNYESILRMSYRY